MNGIWVEKKAGWWRPSDEDMAMARRRCAQVERDDRDALAKVIFDALALEADQGGSFYLDGTAVPVGTPEAHGLFCVGGAHEGVALEKSAILGENDIRAVLELLHGTVVELQATSCDPVCVGWRVDPSEPELCFFDVANVVTGRQAALGLGRVRREAALYDLEHAEAVPIAYTDKPQVKDGVISYAAFMKRRRDALGARGGAHD